MTHAFSSQLQPWPVPLEPPETPETLGAQTAAYWAAKQPEAPDIRRRVCQSLSAFRLKADLSEAMLRQYSHQFYIHSAQDQQRQPDRWERDAEEPNLFHYILGFELLKMMFRMSWSQHEQLYHSQRDQDQFFSRYIQPIQSAHRLNGVIVPKDIELFFAKRDYFVQQPVISSRKLLLLTMATFTAKTTAHFGLMVMRHPDSLRFDASQIIQAELGPLAEI